MPILGTVASQFSGKSFGSYESIATITGNGSFTSIPSTYKHLQLRVIALDTYAPGTSYDITMGLNFNSDSSASNYFYHYLTGNGSSASAFGIASGSYGYLGVSYADAIAGYGAIGGVAIIDIIDYQSTTKNKTVRYFSGVDYNGSVNGNVVLGSGAWANSTTAISSIGVAFFGNGTASGTKISLYGIKG